MLESIDEAGMHRLMLQSGSELDSFDLSSANVGDVVRVTTMSGNTYLFEVTDPTLSRAHVVRCEARHDAASGYRGEREITTPILKGVPLHHGHARTSSVMRIFVLPR